jgi:hypothetical protein
MLNEDARQFLFGFIIDNSDNCGVVYHVEVGNTIRGTFDEVKKNISGHVVMTSFPSSVTFEVRENHKSFFKIEVIRQKTYEEYYAMCVRAWTKFKAEYTPIRGIQG